MRAVWEAMPEDDRPGYTTVLKLLQIMHQKELVERDDSERAHVFRPRHDQASTQGDLLGDLVDRAFEGSASKLVLRALSSRSASADELAQIRELLDSLEGDES